MKTIYLIRHAQPAYPGGKRICLGQKVDVPLSDEGVRQAQRLGRAFRQIPLEAVFASPMLRAQQTAQCLAGEERCVQTMDGFKELDGGVWDGQPFDVIRAQYPSYFVSGVPVPPPPGGESDEQGLSRMREAFAQVTRQVDRCAAIVAHSGVNRVFLCGMLDQPLAYKKRIPQEYASVSVLCFEDGVWRVREAGIPLEEWENR